MMAQAGRRVVAVSVVVVAAAAAAGDDSARPNLLLLFPDQWRFDWDGVADHGVEVEAPQLSLPNLKRLRDRGTRFTQAYVPAPVCAPSRACLASLREYDFAGLATNGANDYDVSVPTFFQVLRDGGGYHTMAAGKDDLTKASQLGSSLGRDTRDIAETYHQGELGFSAGRRFSGKSDVISTYPAPHEPYGFALAAARVTLENGTEVSAWEAHAACAAYQSGFSRRRGDIDAGLCEASTFPQTLYEDDFTAAQALELLAAAPAGKPWFLWVSFPGPHPPFATTARMHRSAAERAWPSAVDSSATGAEALCDVGGVDGVGVGMHRCDYAAEIENLDRLFGLVLDAVAVRGDAAKTVVCATSDHGEMLGDHGDDGKSRPWQGAVSVPLVCAGPGIRASATVPHPVATLDLGATFLDYAGLPLPKGGATARSFRGLLERPVRDPISTLNRTLVHSGLQSTAFNAAAPSEDDEAAFSFRLVVAAAADPRLGTFKFICCRGPCPGSPSAAPGPDADGYTRLLYDVQADPFDQRDLRPSHPALAATLEAKLPIQHGFNCTSDSAPPATLVSAPPSRHYDSFRGRRR